MMSLAQWTTTRRVDHVNLGVAHPRVRGQSQGLTNLKVFDADVAAFAAATNNFDRVSILGRIIQQARAYLGLPANTVAQRYVQAVNTLYQSASVDFNRLTGAAYQALRNADLAALATGRALAPKNITLNIYYLAPQGAAPALGPTDAVIDAHILHANNAVYQRASITFVRANAVAIVATQTAANESILAPAIPAVPLALQGAFADGGQGGPRLITYCNATLVAANSIDVVYCERYDQNDVMGRTFRAGQDYNGTIPARPIVTVTLNPPPGGIATYPATLAHELGHALTGEPGHSIDANNLMAGGAIRNGNDTLSDPQLAWFRNNPYT